MAAAIAGAIAIAISSGDSLMLWLIPTGIAGDMATPIDCLFSRVLVLITSSIIGVMVSANDFLDSLIVWIIISGNMILILAINSSRLPPHSASVILRSSSPTLSLSL